MIRYDMMLFIYCNWVSSRWQCSVNVDKNRKETAVYKGETIHKTIQKYRIHKIENKYTEQENILKKNIKQLKSRN